MAIIRRNLILETSSEDFNNRESEGSEEIGNNTDEGECRGKSLL